MEDSKQHFYSLSSLTERHKNIIQNLERFYQAFIELFGLQKQLAELQLHVEFVEPQHYGEVAIQSDYKKREIFLSPLLEINSPDILRQLSKLLFEIILNRSCELSLFILDGIVGCVTLQEQKNIGQQTLSAINHKLSRYQDIVLHHEMIGSHQDSQLHREIALSFFYFLYRDYGVKNLWNYIEILFEEDLESATKTVFQKSLLSLQRDWFRGLQKHQNVINSFSEIKNVILFYTKGYRLIIFCVFLLLIYQALFAVFVPVAYKVFFDHTIPTHNLKEFMELLILVFGGFAFYCITTMWATRLWANIGANILSELRQRGFEHLQDLPSGYYYQQTKSDAKIFFINDVNNFDNGVLTFSLNGIRYLLEIILGAAILFFVNWEFALLTTVVLTVVLLIPRMLTENAIRYLQKTGQIQEKIISFVEENLQLHHLIHAFSIQSLRLKQFKIFSKQLIPDTAHLTYAGEMLKNALRLGTTFTYLVIICFGAFLVIKGFITVGVVVIFITLSSVISSALHSFAHSLPVIVRGINSLRHIKKFLTEKTVVIETEERIPISEEIKKIEFRNTKFYLPSSDKAIVDLNFTINAKESIALVGASGSGKSITINLLMGFYSQYEGNLQVDNRELHEVSTVSWQKQLGLVTQDTTLFKTTIAENIRMGKLNATQKEIEEAARTAEIHSFIVSLEQGYETLVGENAVELSAGQCQRIAIARALLRRPQLLLLDEATSALDPAAEASINETLIRLAETCTIINVTHRLNIAMHMDRIIVLQNGHVVEDGYHDGLLKKNGVYAQLWQKQNSITVSRDGRVVTIKPERLRDIALLASLDESMLNKLAMQFSVENFPAQTVIFEQGAPGDKFYLIARGNVEVVSTDFIGKQHTLAVLDDGDYFGEIALLRNVRRTARIKTITPCIFLTLNREQFYQTLDEVPEIRENFIKRMEERDSEREYVLGQGEKK